MDRNYYVLCEDNCRFPAMTKEQILTAIQQAVETGKIHDVDTGFVTTIKTVTGLPLRFFVGRQDEYAALSAEEKENLFAIFTNDTAKEEMSALLEEMERIASDFENKYNTDVLTAESAKYAEGAKETADNCTTNGDTRGQAFDFTNTSGFGLRGNASQGHWKLWSLPNSTGKYACCLVPSADGSMMLGSSSRRLDRVYANQFIGKVTEAERAETAGIADRATTADNGSNLVEMSVDEFDNAMMALYMGQSGNSMEDESKYTKALGKFLTKTVKSILTSNGQSVYIRNSKNLFTKRTEVRRWWQDVKTESATCYEMIPTAYSFNNLIYTDEEGLNEMPYLDEIIVKFSRLVNDTVERTYSLRISCYGAKYQYKCYMTTSSLNSENVLHEESEGTIYTAAG